MTRNAKKIMRLLCGMAFGTMVAASAPQIANADTNKDGDGTFATAGIEWVSVNLGSDMKMRIKPADGKKEVYVGIGKVNKNSNLTVASWEVYETGNFFNEDYAFDTTLNNYDEIYTSDIKKCKDWVKVDLSKLNKAKDNYIVLTTPGEKKENVAIITLNAAEKGLKARFNAITGEVWAGKGSSASLPSVSDPIRCSYRVASNQWDSLYYYDRDSKPAKTVTRDFSGYQMQGAKMVLRFSGLVDSGTDSYQLTKRSDSELTYNGIGIKPYDGIQLPGKEVKLTIPARAKAPKAKVNYEKDTVKFPTDCEYRLSDGVTITEIKDVGTTEETILNIAKASLGTADTAATAKIDITKPFVIEYRKKQTEKKPASKWGVISIAMGAIS